MSCELAGQAAELFDFLGDGEEEGASASGSGSYDNVLKKPASASDSQDIKKKPSSASESKPIVFKKPAMKRPSAAMDPPESEPQEEEEEEDSHRDRMKARKFTNIYDQLPSSLQEAYMAAKADKSGKSRQKVTGIINKVVGRDPKTGALVVNTSEAIVSEICSKMDRKFHKELAGGIIREEAEQRVGGSAKLEAAIQRGAVRVGKNDNIELFFFPYMETGKEKSFITATEGSRTKSIADDTYQKFKATLEKIGWSIGVSQQQLEDVQATEGEMAVPTELQETMQKMHIDLQKALKSLQKVTYKVDPSTIGQAGKIALQGVQQLTQEATRIANSLNWLIKFKADQDGNRMTIPMLKKLATTAATNLQNMLESYKVVKGLV